MECEEEDDRLTWVGMHQNCRAFEVASSPLASKFLPVVVEREAKKPEATSLEIMGFVSLFSV